jgi:hypothetical protein
MSLIYFVMNIALFMREYGVAERKNRTLTEMVNVTLDTAGLS